MVVVSNRPTYVAERPHKQAKNEDESELGLVDTAVAARCPDDPPVPERTSDKYTKDRSDETTQLGETLYNITMM